MSHLSLRNLSEVIPKHALLETMQEVVTDVRLHQLQPVGFKGALIRRKHKDFAGD